MKARIVEYPRQEKVPKIVRLRVERAEDAGALLATAYQDDPQFTYILPNHNKRQKMLTWMFSTIVKAGKVYGDVLTTHDLKGVAVWLRPGYQLSFGEMIGTGLPAILVKFGWLPYVRAMRLNQHIEGVQQKHVGDKRWYLVALGVPSAEQGQDIRSALLKPILQRARAMGVPCYLETFDKQSRSFYVQQGFAVVAQGKIPFGGPHYWAMVKR